MSLSAAKLCRLPPSATEDFNRFCANGDDESLRRLLIAVLTDHLPDKSKQIPSWSDETKLIEDLGYDSLAIAEMIFYFEDLFQISISNEEILHVRTLGELHVFVHMKAKAVAA
ncbi:MAG: phosphopantetheine-binding protein [Opitutaceae bacterium]